MVDVDTYGRLTDEERVEFARITDHDGWNDWVFLRSGVSSGVEIALHYRVEQLTSGEWGIVSRTLEKKMPYVSRYKRVIEAIFMDIAQNYGR